MSTFPQYAVLNCHVTEVLGLYDTAGEAATAAEAFGKCSFSHQLNEAERAALAAQQ